MAAKQIVYSESSRQAILRGVIADAQPLIESREVPVTLLRVSTRRFANTLRVNVSFRMANRTAMTSSSRCWVRRNPLSPECGG